MQLPHQPKLHYEDLNDALHDLVQALGGFKKVGPRLWGESLTVDDAADRLRKCLNKDRREKLAPHELILLLRWGRESEFHGAKYFLDDDVGYARTPPVDPREEKSKAVGALQAAVEATTRAAALLERAIESETKLRAVK